MDVSFDFFVGFSKIKPLPEPCLEHKLPKNIVSYGFGFGQVSGFDKRRIVGNSTHLQVAEGFVRSSN